MVRHEGGSKVAAFSVILVDAHHAIAGSANPNLSVFAGEDIVDVAFHGFSVSFHQEVVKFLAIVHHDSIVGTYDDVALVVFTQTVYVVVGKSSVVFLVLVEYGEAIAIIHVQTVSRCYPNEALMVYYHLGGKAARQLVVGVEKSAALCP